MTAANDAANNAENQNAKGIMPELPEVTTICTDLRSRIVTQRIVAVATSRLKLRHPLPQKLPAALIGQTILKVNRRGKYLLIKTTHGMMIIHLGMSGSLVIKPSDHIPAKHEHVTITLANQQSLCLIDPRRFGLFLWTKQKSHPLLEKLGKEPLAPNFNEKYLYQIAKKRKTTIKQLIMDNHVVTGIGNIYASEILFAAKISPFYPANKLSTKQCQWLVKNIKNILRFAIKKRGTTFRDYVDGRGQSGNFQKYLKVYGRENKSCLRCKKTLTAINIGQRKTVYCPNCQSEKEKQFT